MTQPQIEPDSEPEFLPLEEEQEPSFGTVDWDDVNTEDGTAYVPSTTSWIIKEWTPTAGEAIGQINLKHRFNAQHGNQIAITGVMSAAPQPTTIPGATSDGPQVAPEAPAYMSGVTLNGG